MTNAEFQMGLQTHEDHSTYNPVTSDQIADELSFCDMIELEAVASMETKGELRLSFCVIIKIANSTLDNLQ